MNGPARAAVEAEITKLSEGIAPGRADSFANAIRRNARNWEDRLASSREGRENRWLLLEAYVARITVIEDPREIFYDEKLAFARRDLERLLSADGEAFAGSDPVRLRLVTQLKGGNYAMGCRHAAQAATITRAPEVAA